MKIILEGKPEEIKNVLQAIGGSKEHINKYISLDGKVKDIPKDFLDQRS